MTARLPLVINSTTIEEIQSGDTYTIGTNATGTTPTFTGIKETSTAISASAIDLTAGNYFTKTISGTTTFTISNAASSGTVNSFILQLTNGGSATVNWFSGVKWAGGTAPTSVQDYGAFVDIGGLEGLLPVSEIAWSRVKNIHDVLSVGQLIKVVIKSIDRDKERISLSIKDTLGDPWLQATDRFPEGSFQSGTVARLDTFGAFVTLDDGIDGLLHISKLGSGKRINHPREVIKEGEKIEVKIESIDRDNRRISLALAGPARAAAEEEATLSEFRRQAVDMPSGMGTLDDMIRTKPQRGKK